MGLSRQALISQRLEARLVTVVGISLLVFSLLGGIYSYLDTYQQQIQTTRALEKQLVATVRAQAEVAVYANNAIIAQGVLDGLAENPTIFAARIESSNQLVAAENVTGAARPVATNFSRGTRYPIFSPFNREDQVGWLIIVANEKIISAKAREAAIHQTMLLLVQVLLAAGIMTFVLRSQIVRPITRLARELASLQPGGAGRVKVEASHAADELGQLALSANQLLDATGRAILDLNTANDALAGALAQLANKEKVKSKFFAAASHDLRQPIHAINLFLGALDQARNKTDQTQLIGSIRMATATLRELLESLLDLSKLDAGAVVPQPAWLAAETFFERLDNNLSLLAMQRHLRFKLWFPQQSLSIHTDARLLNSILANLTDNAIKYTVTGGVLVGLRRRGDSWIFQVWDTGCGIDADHLDQIYEEFYQVDNPGRDRTKGLGLGLAITRRIARLLGCRVQCRSQPGKGSCFEVVLPPGAVRVAQEPALPPAEPSAVDVAHFDGKRLMVLEDDRLVATALVEWLKGCGCSMVLFRTAEEALATGDLATTDYFIADVQLAGTLSGLEFLAAVEQQLERDVAAVVVTGNTSSQIVETANNAHWPILFKPAEPMEILARLTQRMAFGKNSGSPPSL